MEPEANLKASLALANISVFIKRMNNGVHGTVTLEKHLLTVYSLLKHMWISHKATGRKLQMGETKVELSGLNEKSYVL